MLRDLFRLRQRRGECAFGGLSHFVIDTLLQRRNLLRRLKPFLQQTRLHAHQRIALRIGLDLRSIEAFIVRERMRIGANAVTMHKGWSFTFATVRHSLLKACRQASASVPSTSAK